jgi:hypothetical protein
METPKITIYYADGRPPETRDMTPDEIALIPMMSEPALPESTDETPSPD